jgi:Zn-dependent peptidase ImmA (M78 family)/transcriptional regulator with XRE-family HTH domain
VLRWARTWRGRSVEDAARKLNVDVERIEAWERGIGTPTVRQGRLLAAFYDRPFLEFFLSRLPNVPQSKLAPDFRLHRSAPDPTGDRELQAVQDWAEGMRHNALDLYRLIGDEPPAFPSGLYATLNTNPERAANEVREAAQISIANQLALKSAERPQMPKIIRQGMESLGILVFKESKLKVYGVRGLTLFENPLPVVVFGTEAPTAQAFTLAHELGHIILQQSAISGPPSARNDQSEAEKAERWCDEFAGAFLIPADTLAKMWSKPNAPQPKIGDQFLAQLANAFSVSKHAMLIRLVQLGYVDDAFYWETMRPIFLKAEADFKGGGRPLYYGSRFRSANGDLYTGLVLNAWENGRITNHNAAELMGTKSLQHLFDIRDNFYL